MKKQAAKISVVLVAAILFASCARSKPKDITPQTIDELQTEIAKVLQRTGTPGVGVALVNKEQTIWAGGVGKADRENNREVTADTMFRVGSITKSFIAMALLKLQEDGSVNLQDAVRDIAPEIGIINPWEKTDPVRIVNLLEHTSGFDDMTAHEFYDLRGEEELPLAEIFPRFPEPQRVRWRPGTMVSYSNPGYAMAGYMIEKAAWRRCEDYIRDTILVPLGMNKSDMTLTPEVQANLAVGYAGSPLRAVPYFPIYLRPAGEMKSSAAEMARFVRMMLNRGSLEGKGIVPPESITRMEQPQTSTAAKAGQKSGYGLGVYCALDKRIKSYGHDGGIDGFLSRYRYMPDKGLGYFLSVNASGTGGGKALRAIDGLVFRYITRGVSDTDPPRADFDDAAAQKIAGYYEFASPRNERFRFITDLLAGQRVFAHGGAIYQQPILGLGSKLVPAGTNQFRTKKQPDASVIFTTDPDGHQVMSIIASPLLDIPASYRKANPIWPVIRLLLYLGAVLTAASTIPFAIIWIPRWLFGRLRKEPHLDVRVVPLLAAIAGGATSALLYNAPALQLETRNFRTIGFAIGTVIFAALSALSLFVVIRALPSRMHRAIRIYSAMTAVALFGLTIFLARWGMIGFRFWAW